MHVPFATRVWWNLTRPALPCWMMKFKIHPCPQNMPMSWLASCVMIAWQRAKSSFTFLVSNARSVVDTIQNEFKKIFARGQTKNHVNETQNVWLVFHGTGNSVFHWWYHSCIYAVWYLHGQKCHAYEKLNISHYKTQVKYMTWFGKTRKWQRAPL